MLQNGSGCGRMIVESREEEFTEILKTENTEIYENGKK